MSISQEEFIRTYPTLFHVSLASNMEQIVAHGLLSTSALLDLCEIQGTGRFAIESSHRREPVPISHAAHGNFLINDQAPMQENALQKCLMDMSPRQWYESLNRRVFFWPTSERLEKHLNARLARARSRLVLSFDTRAIVERFGDRIELSPINSGNTMRNAAARGSVTFLPLARYPFQERKKRVGVKSAVAEVTVPYAITPEQLAQLAWTGTQHPSHVVNEGTDI